MSKMSNAVKMASAKEKEAEVLRLSETVENYMGGDSYVINPLDTLKMVTSSSIFGEPAYYRNSVAGKNDAGVIKDGEYSVSELVTGVILAKEDYNGKTTTQVMEDVIDKSLDYDFAGTLDWAVELRKNFNMRLNPQVIMVRAATHPKRAEFTEKNPGKFDEVNNLVMSRADEPMTQMAYYLYKNGKKNGMPSILKRSWAKKLGKLKRYQVAKYKNHEIGMVNAVRLCHANSKVLNELMQTGTVVADEDEKTWENLRSEGKSWKEIIDSGCMGHMAMLRNIRNIFTEVNDINFCSEFLKKLKAGVAEGKQFPFRYYSALQMIEKASDINHKQMILDALEECMDLAMENFPKLKGRTMCLSDNSGSAWGTFNSEFGKVTVADIDNLSATMTAVNSDEGWVGKFGDKLINTSISKRAGVLAQAKKISSKRDYDVGGATEGGIWKFFRDAINNKEHWDNIFIYSDQQAGHGGLYGTETDKREYGRLGFGCDSWYRNSMINVFKLIQEYRKYVNPKVNVFSIQTAGYENVLIPEMAYRTAILYGWTGKETVFADAYIKQWDAIEAAQKN